MVKLNFVGDISLNNIYEKLYDEGESPFGDVQDIFEKSDFNIGNLECLSNSSGDENLLKFPRLKTDTKTFRYLKNLKFNLLNLAHNHVYDNMQGGFESTCNKLDELGIDQIGACGNSDKDPWIYSKIIRGQRISFISCVHKDTNPKLPKEVGLNIAFYDKDIIVQKIKNCRKESDFIILLLHWGGRCEEGFIPDWYQPLDAKCFIDSGADLIVGGHSHTVQSYEKYRGKYIFYSLGNFCFDDVVTEDIIFPIGRFRKRRGVILTVDLDETNSNYQVKLTPIKNRNGYIFKTTKSYLLRLKIRNVVSKLLLVSELVWSVYFRFFRTITPVYIYMVENPEPFVEKIRKFTPGNFIKQLKKK